MSLFLICSIRFGEYLEGWKGDPKFNFGHLAFAGSRSGIQKRGWVGNVNVWVLYTVVRVKLQVRRSDWIQRRRKPLE